MIQAQGGDIVSFVSQETGHQNIHLEPQQKAPVDPQIRQNHTIFQKIWLFLRKQFEKHLFEKFCFIIASLIVVICSLLYTNIFGVTTIENWQSPNYVTLTVPDTIIYNRFLIDEANLENKMKIPPLNDTFKFLEDNRFCPECSLLVIVGESGIGKSTALKEYAKKLRKENIPVMYISIERDKPFIFQSFLMDVFGTTNRNDFSNVIRKFEMSPTLIVDNIQLAKNDDGTLNEKLLTFLNGFLMQSLGMKIILLSSQNRIASEIKSGI